MDRRAQPAVLMLAGLGDAASEFHVSSSSRYGLFYLPPYQTIVAIPLGKDREHGRYQK